MVYYSADDGIHGSELWRSDGTASGTKMVKDINPAANSSYPSDITILNGKLYFFASTVNYGTELWISDGTAAGTTLLKDMVAGSESGFPMSLCNVNGTLFFINQTVVNFELWKTDGTSAGTVMITDLTADKNCTQALQLVAVKNLLFFTAENTSYNNRELWRSDGTAAGTFMVKDISPNPTSYGPSHLTAFKNKLYFCAYDGVNQYLWVSDGTPGGTTYASGYNNVTIATTEAYTIKPFLIVAGSMYFPAIDTGYGSELFKYNPDNGAGIELVKDINASGGNTYFTSNEMAAIGDTIYFAFKDINNLPQLWRTTGTAKSTQKVTDLTDATSYGGFSSGNGMIYFTGYNAATGWELWRSDGTRANTGILKDIYKGSVSGNPRYLTVCNNKVFFSARNTNGSELWQTDGSGANTLLVKNINKTVSGSSSPNALIAFNNTVIFSAYSPDRGTEPFTSDGTDAGTHIIKDILPDERSSSPMNFKVKNNITYFSATSANDSICIFKTDGTATKTIQLCAIAPSYNTLDDYVIADNGIIFYLFYNYASFSYELWRTDGTTDGTFRVRSGLTYYSLKLTIMGNNVYFVANDNTTYGYELWKSDGTFSGTKMLKDIFPGSQGSNPHDLFAFNGILYFGAYNGTEPQLWKTDGTASGTKAIKNVYAASIQESGGTVYFNGNTSTHGSELWKTDGSVKGTVEIKDIAAGITSSNPIYFTDVNGVLFFIVSYSNGTELWKTNGASENTVFVKSFAGSSNFFKGFTAAASRLFFLYFDGLIGDYRLWISDGTDNGTHIVDDEGLSNISISNLKGNKAQLYFIGSNLNYGTELYVGDASLVSDFQTANAVQKAMLSNDLFAQLSTNPFSTQLSINISSPNKQKAKLIVSDASGNIYYTNIIDVQAGSGSYKINTASWLNGVYLIKISEMRGKGNVLTMKALKVDN